MALASGLLCALAASAAAGASILSDGSDLFLVAGMDGDTLTFRLWALACLCGIVLSLSGFRSFVIGREMFSAAVAAIIFCALLLAASVGVLFTGFLALFHAETGYFVLDELDRPDDQQIVVDEFAPVHDTYWHVYRGGPFHYEEITESLFTDPDCRRLGANGRWSPFAEGDYTLTTDSQGRDVLSFTVDDAFCSNNGTYELVLP
ncbi:hypothetical protein [Promicromonospora sukumoe]